MTASTPVLPISRAIGQAAGHRADFPILARTVNGKPLVYMDNAATTQKPSAVIDAVHRFYAHENANVHRGVHTLSAEATEAFEGARERIRAFFNIPSVREVIFTRGTTEAINLVAQSFLLPRLNPGDEILVGETEHHSNIVPWQLVAERAGAKVTVLPMLPDGTLNWDALPGLLTDRTRMFAIGHVSNALGTINPVRHAIEAARRCGVPVLVDGAQATAHMALDIAALDCDFYALSGHKMFGPTGIGVLYGKAEHLEAMPPYQGGGDMIEEVSFSGTSFNELPYKFEAGTPNIAGAIGLGAAVDYLESVGMQTIETHEVDLVDHFLERAAEHDDFELVGTAPNRCATFSFKLGTHHPVDIGTILDQEGVAIRTGHHCAMPVMERLGLPGTARASLAFYNTTDEIDRLFEVLDTARRLLG